MFTIDITSSNLALTGTVGIEYGGKTAYILVDSSASSINCKSSLEVTGKLGGVNCVYTYVSAYAKRFLVEVVEWPLFPEENNLFVNNGNPPITAFYCDITQTNADTSCTFTDIVSSNIKGDTTQSY
jgi:hypothetical protein